ncbi:SRPBCC family protein [Spirosoma rigui]|uniref:START domain-containing protein n=1 Tax=Spirosoma rigui TaxID=564064 RepID=UPI0009B148CE|nr:START domain-containing protein [Spirosoma rigui]
MQSIRYYLFVLLCWYGLPQRPVRAQASEGWTLEKNKDQIQVYSRYVGTSKIAELKVECTIPGTKQQLVALLSDVASYPQVIYGTKRANLIKRTSETQFTYYIVNKLPWPVKDRDMAVQLSFAYEPAGKTLRIQANRVPNLVPPDPDLVRIADFSANWIVHSVNERTLKITYTCRIDPGGSIPPKVENFAASTGAYNSFTLIRDNLSAPRYQGKTFSFMR